MKFDVDKSGDLDEDERDALYENLKDKAVETISTFFKDIMFGISGALIMPLFTGAVVKAILGNAALKAIFSGTSLKLGIFSCFGFETRIRILHMMF